MSRFTILVALAVAAAGVTSSVSPGARAQAPQAAVGTAVLSGRVISADETRGPIRRAAVQLTGGIADRQVAVTDDDGRFEFEQLPAGRYTLVVSKPAYASSYYGARRLHRPPGTPVVLADGERRTNVVIPLVRGAVVAGTVRNAGGQPIADARVMVLEYRTTNGRRGLVPALGSSAQTDDRGEYRLYGLPPGTYVVGATLPSSAQSAARPTSDAEVRWAQQMSGSSMAGLPVEPPAVQPSVITVPVYYPGTPDLEAASAIEVGPGDERPGIDLVVQAVASARLDGVVRHADGRPAPNATVLIVRPGAMILLDTPMMPTRADSNGRFTASPLRPGRYSIFATGSSEDQSGQGRGAAPPAADLWASETVDVAGRDIEGVQLVLRPGMTLSGEVIFDATVRPPPDPARVRLNLMALAVEEQPRLGVPNQTMRPDGTFEFHGISPGTYRLTASVSGGSPPEWMARSALWRGAELLDEFEILPGDDRSGVTITMTDRLTELTGTIFDARGEPAPDFSVLVFPVDRSQWIYPSRRIRSTRPGTNGEFQVVGLPPGDYFVAVLVDTNDLDLGDAALLEEVSAGSVRVRLIEGEKTRQDVKLSGGN